VTAVGVVINSPAANSTLSSPVYISTKGYDSLPITAIQIYVDGVKKYSATSTSVSKSLSMSSGTRRLTVKIWDTAGKSYSATKYITVK
jgi:Bacterial Ig domain